tara:strand:+ start:12691 stop:12903 length:213 start_codon:yes stop_codon:yes gene_type:complete
MNKDIRNRYLEEFDEGSNLLWPSEEEDKITRKFYRDLSHFSKNSSSIKKDTNLIKQLIKIIIGRGSSPKS